MENFKKLGISEGVLAALEKKGFEEPTPIQQQAIPMLLSGKTDIVGQAQTGTGKTAAFGIPIIEKAKENARHVQALILAPTRELAIQVSDEMNELKGGKKISIMPIYGGQSMSLQLDRLRRGVDVVVGTPGRVIDHLQRGSLKIGDINLIVLDEADEMLNMGFVEDVEEVLKHAGPHRQMLLFSATMPKPILKLAEKYMGNYELISVKKEQLTTPLTDQIYFEVKMQDKFDALCRIIDVEKEFYGLVFCRTKVDASDLAKRLEDRGYGSEALHGDVSQAQRERILKKFRDKRLHILTATDVAARGIHVTDLTHVINYNLPQDPESYVHRIGRTGRAGRQGTAITFITPSEFRRLAFIKKTANADIRKGELPDEQKVVETRTEKVREEVDKIITRKKHEGYQKLAESLLQFHKAEDVVAGLLKHIFQVDLSGRPAGKDKPKKDNYVDKRGKTRLYVAMGKKDKVTVGKLVRMINEETGLSAEDLGDIEIYDMFSFVNVPFEQAEQILTAFNERKYRERPLFQVAKEKEHERGGGEKEFKKGGKKKKKQEKGRRR